MVQTQYQKNIHILHNDNGQEYFKSVLGHFFLKKGTVHQSPCVDTLTQNDLTERKNKHLLEVSRTLIFFTSISLPLFIFIIIIEEAKECVSVVYAPNQKGFKCFEPVSKKMFVTMDDALRTPEWKEAVFEEIKALEKKWH
ncbi:hypothetical protein CR513_01833, partial [Mucuna pruriens]